MLLVGPWVLGTRNATLTLVEHPEPLAGGGVVHAGNLLSASGQPPLRGQRAHHRSGHPPPGARIFALLLDVMMMHLVDESPDIMVIGVAIHRRRSANQYSI